MSYRVQGVVVREKNAPATVETIIVPDPGPGEVVVDVLTCGVCHTDYHYQQGGIGDEFPYLLGHESTARVAAVGEGVTEVAVGDRVITHAGRQRPVTELVQRDYSGPVVTVTTSAGSVTTTADHPFLVEREGQLQWVEAASIREGDVTLRFCDRGSDCLDHEVGHVAVERVVGQPYDLVASGAHMGILPGVPVFRPRVPVTAVDLDNPIQSRQ